MKKINIIVAYNTNRGIGYNNKLPWPKSEIDMKRFINITTTTINNNATNAVIMGRKTWDSIPDNYKPLKNRLNIVLSSNKLNCVNNEIMVFNSFESAHKYTSYNEKIESIYVIGGQAIYDYVLTNYSKYIDHIYVTEFASTDNIDKYFPELDLYKYILVDNVAVNNNTIIFKTYKNIQYIDSPEYQYINLVNDIITNGELKYGRNGKTYSLFGPQHIFNLEKGFPLLTTKKMFFRGIFEELIFFINGHTNSKLLEKKNVNIWKDNTTRDFLDNRGLHHYVVGDMGPMYGYNWRHFGSKYNGCINKNNGGYDQLYNLIEGLINDPNSRRHLLTTYDPSTVTESVLAPCHGITIQFNVRNNKYLDCKMYQRSADIGLGYPYNIASYGLFVHIICHVTGYNVGNLIMTLGDAHIYEQHIEQLKKQTLREPLLFPQLVITKEFDVKSNVQNKVNFMENLLFSDIKLVDYNCYPLIKMDMIA
jgi:dihydrofolate reductase / thymidylate synthase